MNAFKAALAVGTMLASSCVADVGTQDSAAAIASDAGLAAELQAQIEDAGFSGVAAIVRDGEILEAFSSGYANRETGATPTVDTRFGLASTGKLFTALSILQLVEQGRISLDDPVGVFLPDYPNEAIRDRATLLHLMRMQSGLGDFFGEAYERRKGEIREHADFFPLFENEPITFEPGSGFEYSNAGYIVLGRIIEIVSGQTYYDYVDQNIFAPAGMGMTGFDPRVLNEPDLAIEYRVEGVEGIAETREQMAGRALIANSDAMAQRGSAAGGGYSTIRDFARFDAALRSGELVAIEKLAPLFGQGFVDGTRPAGMMGGAPGVSTKFRMLPDGRTIIVFGNTDVPSAIEIGDAIEARITSGP